MLLTIKVQLINLRGSHRSVGLLYLYLAASAEGRILLEAYGQSSVLENAF